MTEEDSSLQCKRSGSLSSWLLNEDKTFFVLNPHEPLGLVLPFWDHKDIFNLSASFQAVEVTPVSPWGFASQIPTTVCPSAVPPMARPLRILSQPPPHTENGRKEVMDTGSQNHVWIQCPDVSGNHEGGRAQTVRRCLTCMIWRIWSWIFTRGNRTQTRTFKHTFRKNFPTMSLDPAKPQALGKWLEMSSRSGLCSLQCPCFHYCDLTGHSLVGFCTEAGCSSTQGELFPSFPWLCCPFLFIVIGWSSPQRPQIAPSEDCFCYWVC